VRLGSGIAGGGREGAKSFIAKMEKEANHRAGAEAKAVAAAAAGGAGADAAGGGDSNGGLVVELTGGGSKVVSGLAIDASPDADLSTWVKLALLDLEARGGAVQVESSRPIA
jgi:hypothetical protein